MMYDANNFYFYRIEFVRCLCITKLAALNAQVFHFNFYYSRIRQILAMHYSSFTSGIEVKGLIPKLGYTSLG